MPKKANIHFYINLIQSDDLKNFKKMGYRLGVLLKDKNMESMEILIL